MVAATGEGLATSSPGPEETETKEEYTSLILPSDEKTKSWRKRKWIFLLLLIAYFGTGCAASVPAPFYPAVAATKNVSSTVSGLVFGSFQIAQFLSSPVYGQFLSTIGPGVLCTGGIFLSGASSLLFGFLDQVQAQATFVVSSFLLRVLGGLGESALYTSSFAIVCAESGETATSKFAVLETALAIGFLTGPALGGIFYELCGFGVPFWIVGSGILVNGCWTMALLHPTTAEWTPQSTGTILLLLTSPLVWVAGLVISLGAMCVTFFEPTLSIHLSQFDLTSMEIGFLFVIVSFLYALLAPVYGYLSDNTNTEAPMMMASSLVIVLAFLMIGPSPLLPFLPRALWMNVLSLVLVGVAYSCLIIQPMRCLIDGAIEVGFPRNFETFGMLAGVHNSVYCFGAFFGATLGGAMLDTLGFEMAATMIACMFLVLFSVLTVFFGYRWTTRPNMTQHCKGR